MALGKENPWITAWMMGHHVQWLILNQGISALSTLNIVLFSIFFVGGVKHDHLRYLENLFVKTYCNKTMIMAPPA